MPPATRNCTPLNANAATDVQRSSFAFLIMSMHGLVDEFVVSDSSLVIMTHYHTYIYV